MTATKTTHAAEEAPVPTQVVDREEILATATDNVEEVLDRIPGIFVRRNDQFRLGASTVRMQGADPNKVAVLLDGRRFRGGIDGVVDLRDIPVGSIERIEVIRGPASSLYGSDAMAGVINVITREPRDRPTWTLGTAAGNRGKFVAGGTHGYRRGPFSYFLSYQHDEVELARIFGALSRQFEGDQSDAKQTRDDLFARLRYRAGSEHELSLTANFNPVREGPESDRQALLTAADWHWKPTRLTDVFFSGGRYAFDRKNELTGFEEDVSYVDWSGEGRISRAIPRGIAGESHLWTLGHRVRVERFGSEGRRVEGPSGTAFEVPDVEEEVVQNSPYVQDEIFFGEKWSLVVGSSFDLHERFGFETSPRASLSWRPASSYRLTATVGTGFRAPDLLQLFDVDANNVVAAGDRIRGYVILGNPDLEAETSLGVNLQFDFRPWRGLRGFVHGFRHDFRNLVAPTLACRGPTDCVPGFENPFPTLSGQIFRFQNIGRARTEGVEVSLRLEPFEALGLTVHSHSIVLELGYAYLRSKDLSGLPGQNGNELPFRPPHRFLPSIRYRHSKSGTELQLWGEYEDRAFSEPTNNPEFAVESHWLWNFRLRQRLAPLLGAAGWRGLLARPNWGELELFVEGHNVFDANFGFPGPMGNLAGRPLFLAGLRWERE
ncbi:MAG: catecholate siderophore receptor CirA [Candidatus Binatia bacterium]|nr:MAG: catecholate siderophore receptor CirA [Candidatus Binatia bacterium]